MATTPHLGMTLVEQSQSQKEVTINEALGRIDALLNTGALDKDLAAPPGSPATGDLYIVAASPTGAWAGKAGQLAYYDQVWRFFVPREGMTLWVNDEDKLYSYTGSSWALSGGGVYYDEGNWTPTVSADITGGTPTYTKQVGSYERVGRLVHCRFFLQLSAWSGSPSGNIMIGGLPVASANIADNYDGGSMVNYSGSIALGAGYAGMTIQISTNASVAYLIKTGASGTGVVTAAMTGATPMMVGSFSYRV